MHEVHVALAANKAYVSSLQEVLQSLDEAEKRVQRRILLLRRKQFHAKLKANAEQLSVLGVTTMKSSKRRPRKEYFKQPYLAQKEDGEVYEAYTEPEENDETKCFKRLRACIHPIHEPMTSSLPWTNQDQYILVREFKKWPHSERLPSQAWPSVHIPGRSEQEIQYKWIQHKLTAHKWTSTEDKLLVSITKKSQDWVHIANVISKVTIHRLPSECLIRYQRNFNSLIRDLRKWNRAAERQLGALVRAHGENWEHISQTVEIWTSQELQKKWHDMHPLVHCLQRDRNVILATYCYSSKWNDIDWDKAIYHVKPLGRMTFAVFNSSLSPFIIQV